MKTARTILGLVILAGLVSLGVWLWSARLHDLNAGVPKDDVTYSDKLHRWRSEAELLMLQNSSNDVIGFSKLVEHRLDTSANNVRSWSGDVTADYVNHFGGVDRTNVHYAFGSGLGDLVCYPAPAASMGQ